MTLRYCVGAQRQHPPELQMVGAGANGRKEATPTSPRTAHSAEWAPDVVTCPSFGARAHPTPEHGKPSFAVAVATSQEQSLSDVGGLQGRS